MDKKRIETLMESLDVTYEQAIEILQDDEDIDHDIPKPYDLTDEQKAVAQKYTKTTSHKSSAPRKPREKKENVAKKALISEISQFLSEKVENLSILNAERQISFDFEGEKYELTLVQKRKPKK